MNGVEIVIRRLKDVFNNHYEIKRVVYKHMMIDSWGDLIIYFEVETHLQNKLVNQILITVFGFPLHEENIYHLIEFIK